MDGFILCQWQFERKIPEVKIENRLFTDLGSVRRAPGRHRSKAVGGVFPPQNLYSLYRIRRESQTYGVAGGVETAPHSRIHTRCNSYLLG